MATGQDRGEIRGTLAGETVNRLDFEERIETIRRDYVVQVQRMEGAPSPASTPHQPITYLPPPAPTPTTLSSSTSPSLSNVSSQSSLKQSESQSNLGYYPYKPSP